MRVYDVYTLFAGQAAGAQTVALMYERAAGSSGLFVFGTPVPNADARTYGADAQSLSLCELTPLEDGTVVPLATRHSPLATRHSPLAARHRLPTTHHQSPK